MQSRTLEILFGNAGNVCLYYESGRGWLIHSALGRALDQAVRWGTVQRNVCKATTPPRPDSEEVKPLDAE